jgi:class 3 adenylate cyclase/tetratricopeptide (TPR) repeat protein/ABC-type transport system involved in cytochrome c biogenesis ATPase subunit
MTGIAQWLASIGLERYTERFVGNAIDGDVLAELTEDDLAKLGIPLGDRKRLIKAIRASLADSPDAVITSGAREDTQSGQPRAVAAERRHLTVMICDLVGSTALSARLDPEEMGAVMDAYHAACARIVRAYDGFIGDFRGDGILAYFGYPRAHEDDAERTVRAALDIAAAVARLETHAAEPLAVRIGIATGLVVVGDFSGEGALWEHAVVGDTPNLAARLQTLAEPGTIVVAASTRRLLGDLFRLRDLGSHELKGIAEPVAAWAVDGLSTSDSRFDAVRAAGLTDLIGREAEIDFLLERQRLAWEGKGQIVLISGEPGIGKSCLAAALAERIAGERYTQLRYQCSHYHTNSVLRPIITQLERTAGFKADDTPEQRLDKLEAFLGMDRSRIEAVAPLFAALLSIPFGDRYPPLALSPTQQRRRTLAALLDQFEGLARRRPILLLFEDLHWADATSLELLDLAIERVRQLPVLALLTFRPDLEPPWVGLPDVSTLALGPLDRNEVESIVARVTGGRALPAEVMKQIIDKTDGNPLFVEELTKTVLEAGMLVEDGEGYRLDGPLPPLAIPETLQDSLMARLDRLAPVRELAQIGAAIGREFSYSLVRTLVGRDESALKRKLAQLEQAELVFRRGDPPEAIYTFKHALVRDVAYESLLKSRRYQLHGQIARALQEKFPDIVASQPEMVAHHFTQAGLLDAAIEYWLKAGTKAYSLYANEDAVRFFERASTLLQKLPETRHNLERAVDIRFQLRNALLPLGETDRILRSLDELDPILSRLGDKLRSAQYAAYRCNHHFLIGEQHRAIEFAETAIRLAREHGDRGVLGESLYRLGQSYNALGEYRQAIMLLEQSLEFNADVPHRDGFNQFTVPSVIKRTWLVMALVECGHFDAAMSHAKRALEIAEDADHPLSEVLGWLSIGHVLLRKREIEGAVSALERGLDLCDRWSLQVWRPRLVSDLGIAYARSGRTKEGLELAQQALSGAELMHLIVDKPGLLVRLGQVYLIAGRVEAALTLGKQAVEIAVAHDAKGDEAWARFLIGRACWASDPKDLDESEEQLNIARRLAAECEAHPLAAFCHTTLSAIYCQRGDQAKAQEFDAAAAATYRELGMRPLPLDPTDFDANSPLRG